MSISPITYMRESPYKSPVEGPSRGKFVSPTFVIGLLLLVLILLRLPSALLPRELNVDEGQALAGAMKVLTDPRPWLGVDMGSWGPLNIYLINLLLLMGFKPGFILVHIVATVLVCFQVILGYLTIKRFASQKAAILGACLMVLVYGLSTKADFSLHYAGELLPALLLMLGFYIFVRWLEQAAGSRLSLLFLGGVVLGMAPWCKSQAAPVSGALGLVFFAAILRNGLRHDSWRPLRQLIAFGTGAVLTSLIMFAILVRTGALQDFWSSFVRGNAVYAGEASWARMLIYSVLVFVVTPLNQLLLVGIALLIGTAAGKQRSLLSNDQKWITCALLVYAGASLFAVCRVQYLFPHHAIFMVAPVSYIIADLAAPALATWTEDWRSRAKRKGALLAVVLAPVLALYVAYAVRYVDMIKAIRQLPRGPDATRASMIPDLHVRSDKFLDNVIGPSRWFVPDSNERIAAAVANLERTHPVHSLMIWGVAPGVYVLTGMSPATRYSTGEPVKQGPLRTYYMTRLLGDLRASRPDLFIDAVGRGMLRFDLNESDGYESVPELREFVDSNYTLVETFPIIKGSKPVRFFLRRSSASNAPATLRQGRR